MQGMLAKHKHFEANPVRTTKLFQVVKMTIDYLRTKDNRPLSTILRIKK